MSRYSRSFLAYADCLFDVLEGRYSNSEIDPGKKTYYGFSAKRREALSLPTPLNREEALAALYEHYWLPLQCDEMSPVVAWLYCDVKFNHGTVSSNKVLQAACGAAVDGQWGPASRRAFASWRDHKPVQDFVEDYMIQRERHYVERTRFLLESEYKGADQKIVRQIWRQLRGWLNRLIRLTKALYAAGFIRPPLSKQAVNSATTAGAATAAIVVGAAEVSVPGAGESIVDVVTQAATSVHPILGLVVPTLGGWLARRWARLRGR